MGFGAVTLTTPPDRSGQVRSAWHVVVDDELIKADETAAFLQSFVGPAAAPVWSGPYIHWKIGDANPAGRGFLTLAIHDEKIVGVASITKKRLWLGDRVVTGGELGDCYTDAGLRRHGFAATLFPGDDNPKSYLNRSVFGRLVTETRRRAEAEGINLIYGTPNAAAMPGYRKRLGFPEYESHFNANLLRPTPCGLAFKFPFVKPFMPLLVPLDALLTTVAGALSRFISSGVEVRPTEKVGDEIDWLWDRIKNEKGWSIVRDARWFQYRFLENPIARYVIYEIRRKGELKGIVVTRCFNTLRGRPYCYIADWLYSDRDTSIFRYALAEILRRIPRQELDGVLMWTENSSPSAVVARQLGFLSRGNSPIILADTKNGKELGLTFPRLDFTLACSDNV
jgi:hypothetical protein